MAKHYVSCIIPLIGVVVALKFSVLLMILPVAFVVMLVILDVSIEAGAADAARLGVFGHCSVAARVGQGAEDWGLEEGNEAR